MIMKKERLNHVSLDLTFDNIEPLANTGFVKGECKVAYGGENRNYSDISKETFESAEPTVFGVPVVGNWIEDSSEEHGGRFGGHDVILEQKGNEVTIKDTTVPFGFVPHNANPRWVEVEDKNGNSKNYYTVDVILWAERYPSQIQSIIDKGANQSMEIMVTDGDWDEDYQYFNVKEFYYSALCLLGKDDEDASKNVEPCFEESSISVKDFSFNEDFAVKVSELKTAFEGGGEKMKGENVELELDEEITEEDEAVKENSDVEPKESKEAKTEELSAEETAEEEEVEEDEDFAAEEVEEEEISYKEQFLELSAKYEILEEDLSLLEEEVAELEEFKAAAEEALESEKIEELMNSYSLLLTKAEIEKSIEECIDSTEVEIALSKTYASKSLEEAQKTNTTKKNHIKMPGRDDSEGKELKKNIFAI